MKALNQKKFESLPLREKKYARTKISLLNSLLGELKNISISTIKIKNLAQKAEVSEPTFFNYFHSKQHMLLYFIQMWSIEMNSLARQSKIRHHSYINIIKDVFKETSQQIAKNPQIMLEIIAFQAQGTKLEPHIITNAERWLFFPDINKVETLGAMGLESIIPHLLEQALSAGELTRKTDTQLLFLTLSSLFFGTALLVLKEMPKAFPDYLDKQINSILRSYQ